MTSRGHVAIGVEGLETGNALLDTELQRRIEVRKFPRINAETREIKELDMRHFGLEPPIYVEPLFKVGIRIVVERPH